MRVQHRAFSYRLPALSRGKKLREARVEPSAPKGTNQIPSLWNVKA